MFMSIDLTTKKWLLCFLSLLFAWWVLSASATCSASEMPEKTYQITETQISMLETRLDLLDQILAQQNPELTTLQLQLAESKNELQTLRNELSMSKEQLTKAEESLRNANLYLEQCAAEEKKTRLKIKAQRNIYFIGMVAAAVAAVCHR